MRRIALLLPLSLFLFPACTHVASSTPHLTVQRFSAPESDLPFSSAVLVGNTLHIAGHLGLDPETRQAPEDPAVEAEFLLDAFAASMALADMDMDDLIDVTIYCSDVSLYDTFNAAYRKRFTGGFPSRAFIGSGQLLRGCRFEMLGVAIKR